MTTRAEAQALLGELKRDGLITQRKDGSLHLRSYGRQALAALQLIHASEEAQLRTCKECGLVLPMSVSHETDSGYICTT